MKNLLILLFIPVLFFACREEPRTAEEECKKTILDTFENADTYSPVSFSDFSEADISLDSFRNTGTVRVYVESVCFNEIRIKETEERLANGVPCTDKLTCEELIETIKDLMATQLETLERKEKLYTDKNYVIVHEYMRFGLLYKYRYFFNSSFKVMSVDYLVDKGVEIEWHPIRCE